MCELSKWHGRWPRSCSAGKGHPPFAALTLRRVAAAGFVCAAGAFLEPPRRLGLQEKQVNKAMPAKAVVKLLISKKFGDDFA